MKTCEIDFAKQVILPLLQAPASASAMQQEADAAQGRQSIKIVTIAGQ